MAQKLQTDDTCLCIPQTAENTNSAVSGPRKHGSDLNLIIDENERASSYLVDEAI